MNNIIKYLKIKKWLDHYNIENYTINSDLTIDVNGGVNLFHKNFTKFPDYIQFNTVTGSFTCGDNKLTSLKGVPNHVGGYFDCIHNQLTSLKDAPAHVVGNFYCGYNKLTSLKGAPTRVNGNFYCYGNSAILQKPKNIHIKGMFANE